MEVNINGKTWTVGIDPGVNTGIAIFSCGELITLCTKNCYETIVFLQENKDKIKRVIIENSIKQSHVWHRSDTSKGSFGRKARNTGSVDGMVRTILECCNTEKIDIISISPLGKGKKHDHEFFAGFVRNFPKTSNQHERDALQVVIAKGYHLE